MLQLQSAPSSEFTMVRKGLQTAEVRGSPKATTSQPADDITHEIASHEETPVGSRIGPKETMSLEGTDLTTVCYGLPAAGKKVLQILAVEGHEAFETLSEVLPGGRLLEILSGQEKNPRKPRQAEVNAKRPRVSGPPKSRLVKAPVKIPDSLAHVFESTKDSFVLRKPFEEMLREFAEASDLGSCEEIQAGGGRCRAVEWDHLGQNVLLNKVHSFVRSVCVRGADVGEISKYTTEELEKIVDPAFARLLIEAAGSFFERNDGFINFGRMSCIALDPAKQKYRAACRFCLRCLTCTQAEKKIAFEYAQQHFNRQHARSAESMNLPPFKSRNDKFGGTFEVHVMVYFMYIQQASLTNQLVLKALKCGSEDLHINPLPEEEAGDGKETESGVETSPTPTATRGKKRKMSSPSKKSGDKRSRRK